MANLSLSFLLEDTTWHCTVLIRAAEHFFYGVIGRNIENNINITLKRLHALSVDDTRYVVCNILEAAFFYTPRILDSGFICNFEIPRSPLHPRALFFRNRGDVEFRISFVADAAARDQISST